jgi:ergothioneine biosynthesis protein EgtB
MMALRRRYAAVRSAGLALAAPLSDADMTVQSMPDASPAKWHLAHTTWFFETFVLLPALAGYRPFDEAYSYLFNSYYEAVGPRHARPRRGLLSRPTRDEVLSYRGHVDAAVTALLMTDCPPHAAALIELGLNHEEQHQELFLTDLLHLFAQNPLKPEYRPLKPAPRPPEAPPQWVAFEGGLHAVGHQGEGFAFDCEGPRHQVYLEPFRLRSHPVTNGEWMAFIADGGYRDPLLWLSDGWATAEAEGWAAPLYWENRDGEWWSMTLCGMQPVDETAPVSHVSQYEADAFAAWAGGRLPGECEWEHAARSLPASGHFRENGFLRPVAPEGDTPLVGMFGDVWEWTRSAYAPYPGFRSKAGAVGEYNGKFMSGQYVLKGGSCATPQGHVRASYRNFFHPAKRWQFSGLRLAADA